MTGLPDERRRNVTDEPDRITKAVAMRLAQLDLPDSHTLDDLLNAPWYRFIWHAEQVLEAIREAENGLIETDGDS